MNTQIVENLLQSLDLAQPAIQRRDSHYRGARPLAFTVDEIEQKDLATFNVNICRVAITAQAERLRVKRITAQVDGQDATDRAAELWRLGDMDASLQSVLADALAVGSCYLVAWKDQYGQAVLTAEPADQMICQYHPVTNEVTGAVKRWRETDHQGVFVQEHVVWYGPQEIVHYTRPAETGRLQVEGKIDNPLDYVPVIPLINQDRIGDRRGFSILDDLGVLVDALSKLITDMLVASEATARPKRWATGVDLEEGLDEGFSADDPAPVDVVVRDSAENPFNDADMFISEDPNAKFGQLPGGDLQGFSTGVDIITQQIMTLTALPPSTVGIHSAVPTSADAIRAAESSLTARAEARARVFTRPLELAIRLLVAIDAGVSPDRVRAQVEWSNPATKSVAQEADAITKMHALGIITTAEARLELGYSNA